jgi:NTP pyrophosphatase (non-canonical NTP hydrolase)
MSDIAALQGLIAVWADEVVPSRTPESTIAKLLEELGELIASKRMNDPAELADVAILVLDLFTLQGVDLADAVHKKMSINKQRNWKVADNGAAKHL